MRVWSSEMWQMMTQALTPASQTPFWIRTLQVLHWLLLVRWHIFALNVLFSDAFATLHELKNIANIDGWWYVQLGWPPRAAGPWGWLKALGNGEGRWREITCNLIYCWHVVSIWTGLTTASWPRTSFKQEQSFIVRQNLSLNSMNSNDCPLRLSLLILWYPIASVVFFLPFLAFQNDLILTAYLLLSLSSIFLAIRGNSSSTNCVR